MTSTLSRPKDIRVLPGMTASVHVDFSQFLKEKTSSYLPVSAVVSDVALKGTVWIVNEEKMDVELVSVIVGMMKGNLIQVTGGLKEGQRMVISGVPFLYNGLKCNIKRKSD